MSWWIHVSLELAFAISMTFYVIGMGNYLPAECARQISAKGAAKPSGMTGLPRSQY
jgi:hypothetical protein